MSLPSIARTLLPAYSPCAGFNGACSSMRWAPQLGHVPRGFCGAFGDPLHVRLVLVVAEPGDPHDSETHPAAPPATVLASTHGYAYLCFRDGKDQFHRNVRKILDLCFPDLTFDQQMHVCWITESVLCSAKSEGARVPKAVADECRRRHLEPQLREFPNAAIVALGSKAAGRMKGWNNVITAIAAAPPGCNSKGAEESWRAAAKAVRTATA